MLNRGNSSEVRILPWILVLLWGCQVQSSGLAGGELLDAGPEADGATCMPAVETCDGTDEDCDTAIDEGFDLVTDLENCGRCGAACPPDPANATPVCADGACGLTCDAGFENCNADAADGCEADLSAPATCGNCTTTCSGLTPLCDAAGGACVDDCPGSTTQCNASCVDTDTNVLHCSGCTRPCPDRANATAACNGGTCGFTCQAGFGDCDAVEANGCEQPLNDIDHCGDCDRLCRRNNATTTCPGSSCTLGPCGGGFGDCDGMEANGCELPLTSLTNCAGCGRTCALTNASESCSTGSCLIMSCQGNFDDCDTADSNGCETPLGTDADCASCGNACEPGRSCEGSSCVCPSGCPCNQTCGGSSCNCQAGCPCDIVCANNCDVTCQNNGTTCTVTGTGVSRVDNIRCQSGADCTIVVDSPLDSDIDCENNNTTCDVTCAGSSSCAVDCVSGAECLMRCDGGGSCGFDDCHATKVDCPGNIKVCGRACP